MFNLKQKIGWSLALSSFFLLSFPPAHADSEKLVHPANNHIYQRFDTAKTWSQAKESCSTQGGYLATITSKEENDWIWNTFSAFTISASTGVYGANSKVFWLGGSDASTEGKWTWVTGELWDYSNWSTGNPNNADGSGQNYTVMWNGGSWDDGGLPISDDKISYVCEWNPEKQQQIHK